MAALKPNRNSKARWRIILRELQREAAHLPAALEMAFKHLTALRARTLSLPKEIHRAEMSVGFHEKQGKQQTLEQKLEANERMWHKTKAKLDALEKEERTETDG